MADTLRRSIPEIQPERRKVGVVNLDRAVQEVAQERAEETLTRYTEAAAAGGFLKKVWNSVVTQNLFREYYRERAVAQARAEILKERSLYGGAAGGKQAQLQAEQALAEYLVAAGVKDLEAHTESKAFLGDSAAELAIKTALESQVSAAAIDITITREAFDDNIRPILLRAFEAYNQAASQTKRATLATPNTLLATNLWDVVTDLRALKGHDAGVQTVRRELDICLGELRHGARTAAEESQTEKILSLLNKRVGLGSMLANESTVGAAIALGVSTVSMAGRSVMGQAAFWAGGLIGSSAVGAKMAHYREGRRLDRERWLHDRQVAQGEHTPEREPENVRQARQAKIADLERQQAALKPWNILQKRSLAAEIAQLQMYDGDRRVALNEVRVESRSVPEALTLLEALNQEPDSFFSNPAYQPRVRDLLIDLDARAHVSLTARRDFLRFSSDSTVAEQRTAFLKLRSQVHARLQAGLSSLSADDRRVWNTDYVIATHQARAGLLNQLEEQDGQYKKYRSLVQSLVAKRAAVAGLLIGGVVQTLAGLMSEKITSPLEAAWKYLTGSGGSSPSPTVQAELQTLVEEAKNIPVPPAEVCDQPFEVEPALPNVATEPVVRDMYYVNAKPTLLDPQTGRVIGGSDLNELQLKWGGERGLTTLPSGERAYVLDISSMKDHESWNGGFRAPDGRVIYSLPSAESTLSLEQIASPKLAISESIKNGQAVMLLVPEGGDRSQAIVLSVDSVTGQALIPESSPVAEYFSVKNGQAQFKGFRLEAAIRTSQSDGVTHVGVLAAFKGQGTVPNLSQSLLPKPAEPVFEQSFPQSTFESVDATAAPAGVQPSPSDIPLTLPITGRAGLESARREVVESVTEPEDEPELPLTDDLAPPYDDDLPVAEIEPRPKDVSREILDDRDWVTHPILVNRLFRYIFGHSEDDHTVSLDDGDRLKAIRRALEAHPDRNDTRIKRLLRALYVVERRVFRDLVRLGWEQSRSIPQLEAKPVATPGAKAFVDLVAASPRAGIDDLYRAVFGHSTAEHPYDYNADVAALEALWTGVDELGQDSDPAVSQAHTRLVEYIDQQHETRRLARALEAYPDLQKLDDPTFKPTDEWLGRADRDLALLKEKADAPQRISTWRNRLEELQAAARKFAEQPGLRLLNDLDLRALEATPAGMDHLLQVLGLDRLESGALPTKNLKRRLDGLTTDLDRAWGRLRPRDRKRLNARLARLRSFISAGVEWEVAEKDLASFGRLGARWLNVDSENRNQLLAAAATNGEARQALIDPLIAELGLRGSVADMKTQLRAMLDLTARRAVAIGQFRNFTDIKNSQVQAGRALAKAALRLPPLPATPEAAPSPTPEVGPEPEAEPRLSVSEHLENILGLSPEERSAQVDKIWRHVGLAFNQIFDSWDDAGALLIKKAEATSNTKKNRLKTTIKNRLAGELDTLLEAVAEDDQSFVRRVFEDYLTTWLDQA